jgi:hypothetical protein
MPFHRCAPLFYALAFQIPATPLHISSDLIYAIAVLTLLHNAVASRVRSTLRFTFAYPRHSFPPQSNAQLIFANAIRFFALPLLFNSWLFLRGPMQILALPWLCPS